METLEQQQAVVNSAKVERFKQIHLTRNPLCYKCLQDGVQTDAINVVIVDGERKSVCANHT
jgi:hypothetical protein